MEAKIRCLREAGKAGEAGASNEPGAAESLFTRFPGPRMPINRHVAHPGTPEGNAAGLARR